MSSFRCADPLSRVILSIALYGVICDSAFYSSDAAIYVSKRHIVEHLSRHTAWVESESEPTTDMRALNVLFALAGDEWRSTNETLYVFRDGI